MSDAAESIISIAEAYALRNQSIARDYSAGVSIEVIAARVGLTVGTAYSIAVGMGAKKPAALDRRRLRFSPKMERNEKICAEYLSGDSLEMVGQRYGMTRERVRQILVKNGHEERHGGFNTERRIAARAKAFPKALEREERRERRKAQVALARELYNAGETYKAIAERLSHPITWVENAIWTTGGPSRNRNVGKPQHRLTAEHKAEIARRYAAGEAPDLIAADFDIARQVVGQIANSLGAYRRPRAQTGAG
jgi:hypothetical protein